MLKEQVKTATWVFLLAFFLIQIKKYERCRLFEKTPRERECISIDLYNYLDIRLIAIIAQANNFENKFMCCKKHNCKVLTLA